MENCKNGPLAIEQGTVDSNQCSNATPNVESDMAIVMPSAPPKHII